MTVFIFKIVIIISLHSSSILTCWDGHLRYSRNATICIQRTRLVIVDVLEPYTRFTCTRCFQINDFSVFIKKNVYILCFLDRLHLPYKSQQPRRAPLAHRLLEIFGQPNSYASMRPWSYFRLFLTPGALYELQVYLSTWPAHKGPRADEH